MANTSKWYSNPSTPVQFMKKPKALCTIAIATSMFRAMPKAAIRLTSPKINPRPPKNSAAIASNAKKFRGQLVVTYCK